MNPSIIKFGVLLLALVGVSFTAHAQQKIGHMNSQALFAELPAVKAAQSDLAAFSKQINEKYTAEEQSLQNEYAALQKDVESGSITRNQATERETKILEKGAELEQKRKQYEFQIIQKEQELMKPAIDKYAATIEAVAKENGYTLIIDSTALLQAGEADDVTALVKAKLGL